MHFLAIQLKRIGDLLLTAPALTLLREARPEAGIDLLVPGPLRGLAECFTAVNKVLPYGGRVGLPTLWHLAQGGWETSFDWTGTDRSALLTALAHAKRRTGYAKFSAHSWRRHAYHHLSQASVRDLHTIDFHRALVADWIPELGREPSSELLRISPEIESSLQEKIPADLTQTPYAVLHPGTARSEKFWPADRWLEVAKFLHQRGLRVVITGTGTGLEAETMNYLRRYQQPEWLDLTGQLRLEELAALLRQARLAIGVDSMAMHLTALWQRPQIVLFGPTNPFHWRPRHDNALILTGTQTAPVTEFNPRMPKSCMNEISTHAVFHAIDSLELLL